MSSREIHLWSLYNRQTKRLMDGLFFDEARAIISSVDSCYWPHWLAWRVGWVEWKSVVDIEGLTEGLHRPVAIRPPPIPEDQHGRSVSHSQSAPPLPSVVTESESVNELQDKRKKMRFQKRMSVTIELNELVFKTESLDISVSGIGLIDPLPQWVKGTFKVRIGKPQVRKAIELMCTVLPNAHDRKRIIILPLERLEDEKALEAWLAA